MKINQDCEWLIQPSVAGTVTLIFHRVSLKYGSNVVVYDGSDTTGTVLWDSDQAHYYGVHEVVPPPLHSSSNALFVKYRSNSQFGGGSYGFYGEYYTNTALTTGIGNKDGEYLHMSTALDIGLPGDKSTYPGLFNYSYNIRPDGVANGSSIFFSLTDFSVSAPGDGSFFIMEEVHWTAVSWGHGAARHILCQIHGIARKATKHCLFSVHGV